MKQIFDQLLQFLQQGITAIFKFVQLVWTWSIDQITRVFQAPWADWPISKQILLVIVIAAVAYALFVTAMRLWEAGVAVLAAFASLLGALVYTLPSILIAGVIAFAGLWAINNLNLNLPTITVFQSDNTTSSPAASTDNRNNRRTPDTTGQRSAE
jgi:hypothetical protein